MAGLDFRSTSDRLYSHPKLTKLTKDQLWICMYSMQGIESLKCKAMGIYPISTNDFKIDQQIVQYELGYTKQEIGLKLHNTSQIPLSDEEKRLCLGRMVLDFPDIIEYDPENDIIFNKLMFRYCGELYLSSPRAKVEGIHHDYALIEGKCPERWLGEFVKINSRTIHDAWDHFKTAEKEKKEPHKNLNPLTKTFETLFELENKFSISSLPSKKMSPEKAELLIKILEKGVEI